MADITQQIQTESDGLAQDLERAGEMSARLVQQFGNLIEALQATHAQASQMVGTATSRIVDFGEQVAAKAGNLTDQIVESAGLTEEVAQRIDDATGALAAEGEGMRTALTAATDQMRQLSDSAQTAESEAGQALETLTAAFEAATAALGDRLVQGEKVLTDFTTLVDATESQWRAFNQSVVDTLSDAMSECGQAVETHIVTDMDGVITTFREALEDILVNVIKDPVTALAGEAENAIKEGITQIADTAIETISQLLQTTIREILESRERSDAEEKVMRELFDRLRPVFEDIWSQFGIIDGIASAVGIDI